MKKIFFALVSFSFVWIAFSCSDDDVVASDGTTEKAKYEFVKKTYQHKFTLQNTSLNFIYSLTFINNDSVNFALYSADTGERQMGRGGHYVVTDTLKPYNIEYIGLEYLYTDLKGRYLSLYSGSFNSDYTVLNNMSRTYFNTGNSSSGSMEYKLLEPDQE